MTAPTAPVTTPAPQSASEIVHQDDASFAKMFGFEDVARADEGQDDSAVADAPESADETTEEILRDEKGRFAKREADAAAAEDAGDSETQEAPAKETEEPAKKPLANFKAFDKEGELDVPADLEIEFKADGEVRKLPLDKIIRHAQNGVYNERLVKESQELRERVVPQYEQQLSEVNQQLQAQLALNARLLQDEEYFLGAREQFLREQTPEVQLQKYQQYVSQMQQQFAAQQEAQASESFVNGALVPAMESLLEAHPEVSWEEAFGKFSMAVAPLYRDGRVPRENFQRVLDLVQRDIGDWVAQRATERRSQSEQARRQLEETQRKAQETVTKQKRTLARALSPMGRPAPDVAKPKPVNTADEAMDAIVASVLR